MHDVFPSATLKGCVFHWTQRVYKKIASLGFSAAYMERKDKFLYLRKLMSLPFLLREHIVPAFMELKHQAIETQVEALTDLTTYIQSTWIDGTLWKPACWSVFRETVRTNNKVEGTSIYLSPNLAYFVILLNCPSSLLNNCALSVFRRV